ncbi:MAG: biopolymer transporter ExbD [Prosthecobacter sp.]
MKRVSNQRQLRLVTEISITPFMDLLLVLLFTVLVAVPLLKADKFLLPAVSSSTAPAKAAPVKTVVLQVNSDQSVTLDGAMLARVNLAGALKQLAKQRPDVGVEVRIHRDLPVQRLVETMGLLQEAGIQKTAVTSHSDAP